MTNDSNIYAAALRGSTPNPAVGPEAFARDKFLLNQKVMSLGSKYTIFDETQRPLFYVDRPLLKMKAIIGVYADEAKTVKALDLTQDSAWTVINFTFTLKDAAGQTIGQFKRQGWTSMIRRTWHIYDGAGNQVATAMEDSLWKAILRRIPYLDIIGEMFRTNFIINGTDGRKLGEFIRRFTLTDKYVMDVSADTERKLDRRLAVGLAILLDNTEQR